jgi:D-alanyl-lipoteichoic acid acyltransferase DltB (MBOAT superfamily)
MQAALLVSMLLGGLWHGAAWTFIAWGLYQAVVIILHRVWTRKNIPVNSDRNTFKNFAKVIIFFHVVVLGWLLFRAQSLHQAGEMLQGLFYNFNITSIASWFSFSGFVLPLLLVQVWQLRSKDLMIIYKQHWLLKTLLYAFMAYLLLGWGVMNAQEFIYFQF